MAERNLTPEIIALISAGVVEPALFMYADFPSGIRRLWTGRGNYDDGDNLWEGVGGEILVENIGESIDLAAQGVKVSLNGLDSTIVTQLTEEEYQGRKAELLLGFWDRSSAAVVVFPEEPMWRGTLDTDESQIGGRGTKLSVNCEHRLVDILRKREIRITSQDQKYLHPDDVDTAFDYIEQIQDLSIPWGRSQQ